MAGRFAAEAAPTTGAAATAPRPGPRYPVLEVAGTPREMGRAIGEAAAGPVRDLAGIVVERFNLGAREPISEAAALRVARDGLGFASTHAPDAVEELRGVAEASGVALERLMLINVRSQLGAAPRGCTSIVVGADAAQDGAGFAGQNWDNDPEMDRFSLVLIRRPRDAPDFMTWCQPGVVAYIGFNEAGIGVCMNALNGVVRREGLGWYFLVRAMYAGSSLDDAVRAVEAPPRAMCANAALVTPQGPADLEIQPDGVHLLRAAPREWLVHTNHCVHPELEACNERYAEAIYGQSRERKARAEALLAAADGRISVADVMRILTDRDGHPTAINRYPNRDPLTGWQRTVCSVVLEPGAGRMHVTRGNPGDNPYETYRLH